MNITIKKESLKSIFILEDAQTRIDWFRKTFDFVDYLVITDKINMALEQIKENKFDLIFLDHDLEEVDITRESCADFDWSQIPNGLEVAEQIKHTINKETQVIVHSMNPVGASNIIRAHPFNIIHVPFWLLHDYLTIV
jgi:CheY-like chemotaxis protein